MFMRQHINQEHGSQEVKGGLSEVVFSWSFAVGSFDCTDPHFADIPNC
jgi:hypothetical protein